MKQRCSTSSAHGALASAAMLASLAVLPSCSARTETTIDELDPPLYVSIHEDVCDEWTVVDAHGRGWTSTQCAKEPMLFTRGRRLPTERFDTVRAAFAALPLPPDATCTADESAQVLGYSLRLQLNASASSETTWLACAVKSGKRPVAIAKVYADADAALTSALTP